MRRRLVPAALLGALVAGPLAAAPAQAAAVTFAFGGTTSYGTMTVDNGTNTGSIPAGTAYSGVLAYDTAQVSRAPYAGGLHTTYGFTDLALTIGTSTVHVGPGVVDVYDDLGPNASYPAGDAVYVNFTRPAPPSGLLAGADFTWIGLGFTDASGRAVTAGALPDLSTAAWTEAFSEFGYGTKGTPTGAGYTAHLQPLTTTVAPPPADPVDFTLDLPAGVVGEPYSATLPAATGGAGSFAYAATGLPPGLALAGDVVAGVPTTAGTYDVTVTATDAAGASATSTTSVVVAPAPVPPTPTTTGPKLEGKGRVTAIGAGYSSLTIGSTVVVWDASTRIEVHTGSGGTTDVIGAAVKVGAKAQWKGRRIAGTSTVLLSKLEIG